MSKTLTLRLDDKTYEKIKTYAESENRPISNFITNATINYIEEHAFVSDIEMVEILSNRELIKRLERGTEEVRKRTGRHIG